MRRFIPMALLATTMVAGFSMPAHAGWHSFYERMRLDWHRNNAWPQPFVNQDRVAVCAPFAAMTQNGWAVQSTLTSDHFDPRTHRLTDAGELKVRDIITQHPEMYRTVFVVEGRSQDITERRTDSVQQTIASMITNGPLPPVQHVSIEPYGRPAQEIKAITDSYRDSMPDPRLENAKKPGTSAL